MIIPHGNLFLVLKPDELHPREQVVVYAENGFDPPLRFLGVVKGKDQLEDLLDKAGIDHRVNRSGDDNFRRAFECSPKQIADDLEKDFQMEDEIVRKILMISERGPLTDAEQSFKPPKSLSVCSSSVRTYEGVERILAWFSRN